MVDPISEEELKRGRRIKQYQQYQDHLDEMNKDTSSSSIGDLQGKKVKNLTSDESPLAKLSPISIGKKSLGD